MNDFLRFLARDVKHPLFHRFVIILYQANKAKLTNINSLLENNQGTVELKLLSEVLIWQQIFNSNLSSKHALWPRNYHPDKQQLFELIVRKYGLDEVWVHFIYMVSFSNYRRIENYSSSRLMEDYFQSLKAISTSQAKYQYLTGKMYVLFYLLITFQLHGNEIYELFDEITSLHEEIKSDLPIIIKVII